MAFLDRRFPECLAAFLAGSSSRGEATPTSDLDLVIVIPQEEPFRWATFRESGWPVEAWFVTPDNYATAFAEDAKRRWPLLPELCRDGVTLRDHDGLAARIKAEAAGLLERGPEPLAHAELDQYRFDLTSMLEDLEGSGDQTDALLVAGGIFHITAALILASHRRWLGQGRWLNRSLRDCAPKQAEELAGALNTLSRNGDRMELVRLADAVLDQVGGRLFEGRSQATWWRS
jgi:predicted nucleotidyltransferase